jgi:hypothetical protein
MCTSAATIGMWVVEGARVKKGCTSGEGLRYNGAMELLKPISNVGDCLQNLGKSDGESGRPQQLDDEPQRVARLLGRQNVSYDPIWEAVEAAYPLWLPVKCNTYRRALLLASSAIQHRSKAFEVARRGRLVCIRQIPDALEVMPKEPVQIAV